MMDRTTATPASFADNLNRTVAVAAFYRWEESRTAYDAAWLAPAGPDSEAHGNAVTGAYRDAERAAVAAILAVCGIERGDYPGPSRAVVLGDSIYVVTLPDCLPGADPRDSDPATLSVFRMSDAIDLARQA